MRKSAAVMRSGLGIVSVFRLFCLMIVLSFVCSAVSAGAVSGLYVEGSFGYARLNYKKAFALSIRHAEKTSGIVSFDKKPMSFGLAAGLMFTRSDGLLWGLMPHYTRYGAFEQTLTFDYYARDKKLASAIPVKKDYLVVTGLGVSLPIGYRVHLWGRSHGSFYFLVGLESVHSKTKAVEIKPSDLSSGVSIRNLGDKTYQLDAKELTRLSNRYGVGMMFDSGSAMVFGITYTLSKVLLPSHQGVAEKNLRTELEAKKPHRLHRLSLFLGSMGNFSP